MASKSKGAIESVADGQQWTSASLTTSERSFLEKFGGGILSAPKLMAIILKGIRDDAFNAFTAISDQPMHRRKDDAQADAK